MVLFLLRRVFSLLAVLLLTVTITFLLIRVQKGGPFDGGDKDLPEHVREQLEEKYKLKGNLLTEQYPSYLGDLLRGDLRVSFHYRDRSVSEILGQKLPISFALGGAAFLIAATGGVIAGTIAALRKNSWFDWSTMAWVLLAVSLPTFVTGPTLIAIFSLWLGWLPPGGWGGWRQIVLPSCCLALPWMGYVARLMRNSLADVMRQDYIRAARAKGMSESEIAVKHAMKVAILPVITFMGPMAASLLTGSLVVESIFSIPGAGGLFVNAIQNRDGFLLGGAVIIYCVLLVVFNFMVDLLYVILDRRIRLY